MKKIKNVLIGIAISSIILFIWGGLLVYAEAFSYKQDWAMRDQLSKYPPTITTEQNLSDQNRKDLSVGKEVVLETRRILDIFKFRSKRYQLVAYTKGTEVRYQQRSKDAGSDIPLITICGILCLSMAFIIGRVRLPWYFPVLVFLCSVGVIYLSTVQGSLILLWGERYSIAIIGAITLFMGVAVYFIGRSIRQHTM